MNAPASAGPGPGYAAHPGYRVELEPMPKRIRATLGGATVVDSLDARILYETAHIPVYYFPRPDVRLDLLTPTDHTTNCPFKGDASYWTVEAGGKTAANAVWSYERPYGELPGVRDLMAVYWDRMDHWYEEDEEVFVHARSPRVRVDILDSRRRVEVVLGGAVVAATTRARFLFETGQPVRYYIPADDVAAALAASERRTQCPYKGTASYYTVRSDDTSWEDIVWCYPDPVRESARIENYLCFFNERVDAIRIDGVEQPRPRTKWSR